MGQKQKRTRADVRSEQLGRMFAHWCKVQKCRPTVSVTHTTEQGMAGPVFTIGFVDTSGKE